MLLRAALLGLMAVAVLAFGVVAWVSLQPPPAPVVAEVPPPAPPPTAAVLAAAHPLRPGTLLKPEDLTAATVPVADVPPGARLDALPARSELVGAMLRQGLVAGQPILPSHVLRPVDHGFLAAVLRPGTRATTVGVDAVSGAAGLIWPGDRVDLVLTQTLDDAALPAGRRVLGETVMVDLRVIAIDQKLVQGATPGTEDTGDGNRTVTLEATPAQVERVAVAARLGKLSLAVRPGGNGTDAPPAAAADPAKPDPARSDSAKPGPAKPAPVPAAAGTVWGSDVSPGLVQRATGSTGTMRLFQGTADGKEFKFP